MKHFSILILAINSSVLFAQSYAIKLDSITKVRLEKLPKEKQSLFDSILIQRLSIN